MTNASCWEIERLSDLTYMELKLVLKQELSDLVRPLSDLTYMELKPSLNIFVNRFLEVLSDLTYMELKQVVKPITDAKFSCSFRSYLYGIKTRPSCNPVNNKMSTFRSYLYGIKTIVRVVLAFNSATFRSYLYGIKTRWQDLGNSLAWSTFRSYLYGIKTVPRYVHTTRIPLPFRSYLYGIKTGEFLYVVFTRSLSDLTYVELKFKRSNAFVRSCQHFLILPIWN